MGNRQSAIGKSAIGIGNRQSKMLESSMYRRPKFLEVLHAIREDMSREADYDVDLFAEMVRSGVRPAHGLELPIRSLQSRTLRVEKSNGREPKKRAVKRHARNKPTG